MMLPKSPATKAGANPSSSRTWAMAARVSLFRREEFWRFRTISWWLTGPSGITVSQNRVRITATWARVALSSGLRSIRSASELDSRPAPTAQATASPPQLATAAASS